MSVIELLKVVAEGGSFVLLAAILFGIFWLIVKLGPPALEAWNKQITELSAMRVEIQAMRGDVRDMRARASEASQDTAEMRGRVEALTSSPTGQHAAVTVERDPPREPPPEYSGQRRLR